MKRVLLASVGIAALVASISAAGAADLPRRQAQAPVYKAPVYAPVYNWTGFYVGLNGGGAWGRSRWDTADSFDVSGWLFGGTAGYNWQFGQTVLGVEGDIDWSNIRGTTTTLCATGCETRNSWLATVRGRLGYAFDRILPYVTGGLAVGDIRANHPTFTGGSTTNAGWTVGGGLEVPLAANWTAKAEYLYVDLGKFNCGVACNGTATDNVSLRTNIVRGGINYRF